MDEITETEQTVITCNFCGISQHEAKRMIVGVDKDGSPAICNKCIELAYTILTKEDKDDD